MSLWMAKRSGRGTWIRFRHDDGCGAGIGSASVVEVMQRLGADTECREFAQALMLQAKDGVRNSI